MKHKLSSRTWYDKILYCGTCLYPSENLTKDFCTSCGEQEMKTDITRINKISEQVKGFIFSFNRTLKLEYLYPDGRVYRKEVAES